MKHVRSPFHPKPKKELREPWLVQRCKAEKFSPTLRTGEYLKLDYMGSSEFEWGAIPQFQRDMLEKLSSLVISSITHSGMTLFYASTKDQVEQYGNILKDLIDGKFRMKERSGIKEKETLYVGAKRTAMYDQPHAPYSTDVWLDLTNGLFFARTEEAVKNLFTTIPNAVRYMDQQAKANK